MNSSMSAASSLQALAANIDAALPQTQCTRCGYPDCASYARPLPAEKPPSINARPAARKACAVWRHHRQAGVAAQRRKRHGSPRTLAVIDEAWCIGCTLCIKACPTDAILGANKRMHTVIAEHCTGCELCIPVCPVDCIELVNASAEATGWSAWSAAQAEHARSRYGAHLQRTGRKANAPVRTTAQAPAEEAGAQADTPSTPATDKKATLAAILAKAKAQRAGA
jgi:electron transport complex protein RnfB